MRMPWELIAVGVMTSACKGTPAHIEPGAHHEVAAARDAPPPPSAPAPVVFRILTAAERTARRAKLATEFGATSVLLDFAGYPTRLEIPVPTEPVDLEATTRALVTAHAESFGIQDPSLLVTWSDIFGVDVGIAPRWSGSLHVDYIRGSLYVWGHLWPMPIPAELPTRADRDFEPLVEPFYGATADDLSCRDCADSHVTITRASFTFAPGIALLCDRNTATPRAVVFVVTHWYPDSRLSIKRELPRLVDPVSLEVIHREFLMPPLNSIVDGELVRGGNDKAWPHDGCPYRE